MEANGSSSVTQGAHHLFSFPTPHLGCLQSDHEHEHCEDQQAPDFEQLFLVGSCFQLPDDEVGMVTSAFVNESDGLNMYR